MLLIRKTGKINTMLSEENNNINDHGLVKDNGGVYHTQQPLTFEKVWLMFQETDKRFQETERLLTEQSKKTDKKIQETNKQMKETDKKVKKAMDLFTCQWGRLVESLVEGDLPRVLRERGIEIKRTVERAKSEEDNGREFDIIAVDGDVCVVVEVKTTLRPEDVAHFINTIKHFREWMPEYAYKNRVLGAVAYLHTASRSEVMAQKHGLFTIRATGKSARIVNPPGFEPKEF